MVKRLVYFALHQPMFMCMLTILFVAGGIVAYKSLPIEAFPDVTDVQVQIITLFPGHAPEEIEKQVTIPLEIELSGLPHSVRMFSHTQFGLSFVVITFDDKVDDYFARARVLERLQSVDLPPNVQPQLGPLSTPIGEIYRYCVKSPTLSPTDLRTYEDWVIERHLRRIPGVADVVPFGGFIKRYEVGIDQARLKSYDITIQQVVAAIGRCNANAGASYIEQGEQQYLIRGIGLLKSANELNNVVVAERKSSPILLKDIATISTQALPRQGASGKDDNDEAVTGIVLMRKGENPTEVLEQVKEKINALNETILPKNVRIEPYYDRTVLIETTLGTVFHNLMEGAILVTLVLFLFLGNVRAALIVALMIPLSLLATFVGLHLRGIPANLLSLGAMDFGIVVDGAVIVVENVFRHLSHHKPHRHDRGRIRNMILDASVEVGRPTLFSMLIIIIAYIPIFTLQRQEGRIFSPMAYTVVSALVGSLLFSLTLVPLLCYFFLRKTIAHEENFVIRICKRIYEPILKSALERRWLVVGTAVIAFAVSLVLVPKLGTEFLPELNEGTLWLNVVFPPGISLTKAQEQARKIRKILMDKEHFPEITTLVSQSGRLEDGTDPKTLNSLEMFVGLKPQKEWRPHLTRDELIEQMEKAVEVLPGVYPNISQPIRDNVLESISAIKGQIVVKVFGEDIPTLREKAGELLNIINRVHGVSRAAIDRQGSVPQLRIEVDREQAARYGLNVGDVEDVIETALGGKEATQIWEGEKKFGVIVRLSGTQRTVVDEIKNLLVDTPDGQRIPLDQVAHIVVRDGSISISRESSMRVVAISIFIHGRDMGSIVAEMQEKAKKVKLPAGYYTTWGGEFENQQRAMKRLAIIVPVSIFLIFILLFDGFKSFRDSVLILINVPLALIGGIVALYFTGIPLSVSAAIGFIALFGQAVLNGVVMVSYFKQLRESGIAPYEAVYDGAMVRLRTVLMTALLAMLGLLPMALSKAAGAEVQRPLAVVVIGGLVSATILTLVVLPTLYLLFELRSVKAEAAEAESHQHHTHEGI